MYEQTFLSQRYGYGAAIAAVLFALMRRCIAFFLWRLLRREGVSADVPDARSRDAPPLPALAYRAALPRQPRWSGCCRCSASR